MDKKPKATGKKLKVEREKQKSKPGTNEIQPAQTVTTDDFDFGGLPDRSLKKNLGCG